MKTMKNRLSLFSGIFLLFLFWFLATLLVGNEILLPGPLAVFRAFGALFTRTDSLLAIAGTLLRLLSAMAVALAAGLFLGVLAGLKPGLARFLSPAVTVLRTVPVISIVVIVLILAGFEKTPYVITFLMIFPLFFQAVSDGIRNVDPELVDVYRLEDNRFFSGLWHCYLPLISDQIKTALLQSAGLGIKVLVMAEYLAQTKDSIGNRLYLEKVNLQYDMVFAWTLFLILLAVGLEILIHAYARKKEGISAVPARKRSRLD